MILGLGSRLTCHVNDIRMYVIMAIIAVIAIVTGQRHHHKYLSMKSDILVYESLFPCIFCRYFVMTIRWNPEVHLHFRGFTYTVFSALGGENESHELSPGMRKQFFIWWMG